MTKQQLDQDIHDIIRIDIERRHVNSLIGTHEPDEMIEQMSIYDSTNVISTKAKLRFYTSKSQEYFPDSLILSLEDSSKEGSCHLYEANQHVKPLFHLLRRISSLLHKTWNKICKHLAS